MRPNISAWMRRHKLLATTALVLMMGWAVWLCDLSAAVRGKFEARVDLYRGHYQLLGYGLPTPLQDDYVRCLRERYGVEYKVVAGCIVSPGLVKHSDSYNAEVAAATRRRYGRDVFLECVEYAERNAQSRQMVKN